MKPEESIRLLQAARLMLLGKDNQPVSDLYYALQAGVDAIEEKLDGDWIPIEFRLGTEEEYAEFSKYGSCPRSEFKVCTNKMPEDGQEVLVTTRWGDVCIDTWHRDVDCCYFENNSDDDDVTAWMPKPEGYVPEVDNEDS